MSTKKIKKRSKKAKVIYVCGVDYRHELGPDGTAGAVRVFNSVSELKKYLPCWRQCGIMRVELVKPRWVVRESFDELLGESRKAARKARLKSFIVPKIIKKVRSRRGAK